MRIQWNTENIPTKTGCLGRVPGPYSIQMKQQAKMTQFLYTSMSLILVRIRIRVSIPFTTDLDPNPAIFVSDLQDVQDGKKSVPLTLALLNLPKGKV